MSKKRTARAVAATAALGLNFKSPIPKATMKLRGKPVVYKTMDDKQAAIRDIKKRRKDEKAARTRGVESYRSKGSDTTKKAMGVEDHRQEVKAWLKANPGKTEKDYWRSTWADM